MRSFIVLAACAAIVACGGAPTDGNLNGNALCGTGTKLDTASNKCVPDNGTNSNTCGTGTHLSNGQCVPNTDTGNPNCGAGTHNVNGVCEVDGTGGTGTISITVTAPSGLTLPAISLEALSAGEAYGTHWHVDARPNAASFTDTVNVDGKNRVRLNNDQSDGHWGCTLQNGAAVEYGGHSTPAGWTKSLWLDPNGNGCSVLYTKQ